MKKLIKPICFLALFCILGITKLAKGGCPPNSISVAGHYASSGAFVCDGTGYSICCIPKGQE